MTELSDHELLKLVTLSKLRKLIQRDKEGYQQALHRRCGVGLTVEEFDAVIQKLVDGNWVVRSEGSKGGALIRFNETFNDVHVSEFQPVSTQE